MIKINLLNSNLSSEAYQHLKKNKKPITKTFRLTEEVWKILESKADDQQIPPATYVTRILTELVKAQGKQGFSCALCKQEKIA